MEFYDYNFFCYMLDALLLDIIAFHRITQGMQGDSRFEQMSSTFLKIFSVIIFKSTNLP